MTGILWLDDSDVEVTKKIRDAARCYQVKLGEPATLCYANPSDVPEAMRVGQMVVEPRMNIRPHHFLVGRANDAPPLREAA
ncbi:MAG: hypothetical protein KDD73_06125 [Anaerolineales bacterium]|nr:hypothetical protein [Anaerolineales bacterium]MCB9129275.1 hypothetical protein [Ardenticatenales bacterium]